MRDFLRRLGICCKHQMSGHPLILLTRTCFRPFVPEKKVPIAPLWERR